MKLQLSVEYATPCEDLPSRAQIRRWARAALAGLERDTVEVGVRIVGEAESAELNGHYRGKAYPTNVLSFPFEDPPGAHSDILGDLVICAPVVRREAGERGGPQEAHWAHMVVHGIMHLRGYDHGTDQDARVMEGLETKIMEALGFAGPYA